MAKKLFIGNMPFSMSQQQLTDIFAPYGQIVSVNIVFDKFSGRSKGFGFVEMDSDESANQAISLFDGKELDGRTIKVNEAKPMEDRPPRRDNFSRGPSRDFGGGNRNGGFGGGNRY